MTNELLKPHQTLTLESAMTVALSPSWRSPRRPWEGTWRPCATFLHACPAASKAHGRSPVSLRRWGGPWPKGATLLEIVGVFKSKKYQVWRFLGDFMVGFGRKTMENICRKTWANLISKGFKLSSACYLFPAECGPVNRVSSSRGSNKVS